MNKYYKFKRYSDEFYVIVDNIIYHYCTLSSDSKFYRVRSRASVEKVMNSVGDKLEEMSETDFLRLLIAKGVIEVE